MLIGLPPDLIFWFVMFSFAADSSHVANVVFATGGANSKTSGKLTN